jgi:small subunit ribosomal protein S13
MAILPFIYKEQKCKNNLVEVINLEEASKPDEKKPEKPSEDIKDEPIEESPPEPEVQSEEVTEEQPEEEPTKTEEIKEKAEEPEKAEVKKEKPKKKVDRGPDFKYIVRLSNTDVDGEKNVVYGLTGIKGIGLHMATLIADQAGIERYKKMGHLTDSQIEKIQELINKLNENAPGWMLNHRKDYDTGKDIHLISSDIDMRLRDEINIMKKIRSYRGIRHESGLRVRGQRTRANNRKGLALGVSKKREPISK